MSVALDAAVPKREGDQSLGDAPPGHAVAGMEGQAHEISPWQPANRVG
jgi:hypothetical protein